MNFYTNKFIVIFFLSILVALTFIQQKTYAATTKSWRDDFNGTKLNTDFWNISNYSYSQGAITNIHQGYFQTRNVQVHNGFLIIKLTQQQSKVGTNLYGIISKGGEIASQKMYGYGIYEWRMSMSSTASSPTDINGKVVSGQISSGFTYNNNSQTELDFEAEGQYPNTIEVTTWHNHSETNPPTESDSNETSASITSMSSIFKTYKLVWSPNEVKYYVNSKLVADHKGNIPSKPASVIINQWGTDSKDFGGIATLNKTRYLLVDWIRYTAPGEAPLP